MNRRNMCIYFHILLVMLGLFLMLGNKPCFASKGNSKKIVKVGYTSLQGFLYQKENGNYSGLAYDLLEEIAVYNNWKYEFVNTNYSECKSLLDEGKIDIFIPYQKTPEREKLYEYSKNVFCTNRASLLVSPKSDICFNDYKRMNGITVGVAKATRNGTRFKEFLKEKGCKIFLKADYKNQKDLEQALKEGKIDAFISASNRGIENCKAVMVLPQTNSYVIAKKGDRTYLDAIDHAMNLLNDNAPNFMESLNEKYQIPEDGTYPAMSLKEVNYIKKKKVVTVLVTSDEGNEDGTFKGSAKVLYDKMSKMTNLKFKAVVAKTYEERISDFSKGKVDLIYNFNHDYQWAIKNHAWLTNQYMKNYNKVVVRRGFSVSKIKKVAVIKGTYIKDYVEHELGYKMISCSSYQDGLNKVLSEKVDAMYVPPSIGTYYSTYSQFQSLVFMSAYDFESAYCMGVSNHSDQILVQIINRSVNCIPKSVLSKAFEEQAVPAAESYLDIFYRNPLNTIVFFIALFMIIGSVIFLLIYIKGMTKKNKELAIANSAKTDFLSRMSHDMRTPMNGILGLTELLKDEQNLKVIHNDLDQIELSGKYLLDLINDTLDMNKIESGKMTLKLRPIKSNEVFGNILSNASILAREKNVQLEIHVPPIKEDEWIPVMADASRLEQVLINIISNAIKFTAPKGVVELDMRTVEITDDYVKDEYIIRDSGIGMSKEFLPHLFDPFSQEGKINTNREEGTGLGMSIVKQLVELMDSEILVESELGVGTTVTLHMQYERYHGKMVEEVQLEDDFDILKGKTILLCEDHPINAQIALNLLQKKNIIAKWAKDGQVGLDMFQRSDIHEFDLILMDIRMPEMNGLETTKAIRKLEREDAKEIPILAMTANAFDEDVENCMEAGMNGHLSKPINSKLLYQTIATWLKKRQ